MASGHTPSHPGGLWSLSHALDRSSILGLGDSGRILKRVGRGAPGGEGG